jgi:mannose-6-phosphate isomerase-like protein (cupin superfamily)
MASAKKVLVIDLNKSTEYQKILDGQPQTCGMRCGRVYLKSGQTCGQHSTAEHEEALVFLSGQGELLIGPRFRGGKLVPAKAGKGRFAVGQGKISYIPPNTVHDVKNAGTKPLIYIYCVAPVNQQKT